MTKSSLYNLTRKDLPNAVECLKDAFKDDPLWAEVFRDDPDRDNALSAFFACPLLFGMKFGKASAVSPSTEGLAVWIPGKHADMNMWDMLRSGALFYGMRMGKETVSNLAVISKQTGSDRKRLMIKQDYMYLLIIGVASSAQGKGLGSKLIAAVTEECDNENLKLYLETEKEENLRFYKKHGFTVLEKITLPKLNLPMWLMLREPQ